MNRLGDFATAISHERDLRIHGLPEKLALRPGVCYFVLLRFRSCFGFRFIRVLPGDGWLAGAINQGAQKARRHEKVGF
jgi:hypothetical protein